MYSLGTDGGPIGTRTGRCGQAPVKVQGRPQLAPKTARLPEKSKTVVHRNGRFGADFGPSLPSPGGRRWGVGSGSGTRSQWPEQGAGRDSADQISARQYSLGDLASEWLLDLQVMGRSPRTLEWYRQKLDTYLARGGAVSLDEFSAFEVKRYVVELQDRSLAPNTVHGCFQVLRSFANWSHAQGYPIDPALLRLRAPKLPQVEMESYTQAQLDAILDCAPCPWARLAMQILLGTGVRISELCAVLVDDFEDDGERSFIKIRRGKGAKFRRVPVTPRLRREIVRYLNRYRPRSGADQVLLLRDGSAVRMETCARMQPAWPLDRVPDTRSP